MRKIWIVTFANHDEQYHEVVGIAANEEEARQMMNTRLAETGTDSWVGETAADGTLIEEADKGLLVAMATPTEV